MISADRGIRYEQNHANRKVALVMLDSHRSPIVRRHRAEIRRAVEQDGLQTVSCERSPGHGGTAGG